MLTKEGIPCYNSKFKDFIEAGLLPKVKLPTGVYAKYRLADVRKLIESSKTTPA